MDMEEILGLGSGDFEGVDFAASSESDGEEEPAARGAVKVVPRSNTTTSANVAEISNVENTPAAAAAAAAAPLPAVIGTTTIVQVGLWGGAGGGSCDRIDSGVCFCNANARKVERLCFVPNLHRDSYHTRSEVPGHQQRLLGVFFHSPTPSNPATQHSAHIAVSVLIITSAVTNCETDQTRRMSTVLVTKVELTVHKPHTRAGTRLPSLVVSVIW